LFDLIFLCLLLYYRFRRQYPPYSLLQVQRLIDMGCVDTNEQIDLLTLCNTGHYSCSIDDHHYGVNLIDEVICMEFVLLEIWMCFL
jgi:hypothetical protein